MPPDQERNISIERIKMTLRVVSSQPVMAEIVTLLIRFETVYADLPESDKQAKELTPEVIERKVLAVCGVRGEIKRKCLELKDLSSL